MAFQECILLLLNLPIVAQVQYCCHPQFTDYKTSRILLILKLLDGILCLCLHTAHLRDNMISHT